MQPVSDKRLEELRSLALEYVKQIVFRASELAAHQEKLHERLIRDQVRLAASEINSLTFKQLSEEEDCTATNHKQQVQHQQVERGTGNRYQTLLDNRTSYQSGFEAADEDQRGGRRRGRKLQLNWHLLVACFSNCLPQSIVETATKGGAPTSL